MSGKPIPTVPGNLRQPTFGPNFADTRRNMPSRETPSEASRSVVPKIDRRPYIFEPPWSRFGAPQEV